MELDVKFDHENPSLIEACGFKNNEELMDVMKNIDLSKDLTDKERVSIVYVYTSLVCEDMSMVSFLVESILGEKDTFYTNSKLVEYLAKVVDDNFLEKMYKVIVIKIMTESISDTFGEDE